MPAAKNPWPSAEGAVLAILRARQFSNIRLHMAVRIAFLITGLIAFALSCLIVMFNRPAVYSYVMTNAEGEVQELVPTEKPNQSDEFIVKWAIDAVTRLYSIDFVNYRQQLQASQINLTAVGWKEFERSMTSSGNFRAIINNKYVTSAVPTGPGRVTKSDIHPGLGRHAWRVEFPMVIAYRSSMLGSDGRPLAANQDLKMSIVIIRQPEYLNPTGLGIRSIIAE